MQHSGGSAQSQEATRLCQRAAQNAGRLPPRVPPVFRCRCAVFLLLPRPSSPLGVSVRRCLCVCPLCALAVCSSWPLSPRPSQRDTTLHNRAAQRSTMRGQRDSVTAMLLWAAACLASCGVALGAAPLSAAAASLASSRDVPPPVLFAWSSAVWSGAETSNSEHGAGGHNSGHTSTHKHRTSARATVVLRTLPTSTHAHTQATGHTQRSTAQHSAVQRCR